MRVPLFLKKTRKALGQLIHKPHIQIRRDTAIVAFSLIAMFFTAFWLRMIPLFKDEALLREFDPYLQYRIAEYISQHGLLSFFNWYDELSWYPWGRSITAGNYPGTPFAAVIFYYILQAVGINTDLFMVAYTLPAFMGAATCVATYYLGREFHSTKTGLLAAWFMVFAPAYIQRTMAGFFDNEAMGVFYIVVTLLFFLRSYNRGTLSDGVVAGLFLGLLGATWGAYLYITDLIPLFALILIIFHRYTRKLLASYSTTMGIGLLICGAVPRTGVSIVTSMAGFPGIAVFILMIGIEIWPSTKTVLTKIDIHVPKPIKENGWRILVGTIATIGVVVIVLQVIGALPVLIENVQSAMAQIEFLRLAGRYLTILLPSTRESYQIIASVGEHLATPWGYFFYNLWSLLIFIPLGFYFLYRNPTEQNLLMVLFGLTTLYFSASLIRIILILAPAVSLIAAYGISNMMKPFAEVLRGLSTTAMRRRQRISRLVTKEFAAFGFIALFLLLSLNAPWATEKTLETGVEIKPAFSTAEDDILQGLEYVRTQLSTSAVIACWWDYGYWLTVNTNRSTVCDNATTNSTQIAVVGYAMMSTNISVSVEMFRSLGATHVFVYYGLNVNGLGGDEGKWVWMTKIAWETSQNLNLSWDVNPDNYLRANDSTILDAFYNTTIYKLLRYKAPGDSTLGQYIENYYWPQLSEGQKWIDNDVTSIPFFKEEFFSDDQLFKLYRIDYEAYDAWVLNQTSG